MGAAWGRVLATALLVLSAGQSYAKSAALLDNDTPTTSKLSADLKQRSNSNAAVDVIVQYRHLMPGNAHFQTLQAGGAIIKSKHPTIGAVAMRVSGGTMSQMAKDANIIHISPDRPLHSTGNASLTAVLDYHDETVNAPQAWAQGLNGTGIGVAVIDSGVNAGPDLQNGTHNLLVFSQNFVGGTSGSANDQYGHGSHVTGIIAGTGAKSTGTNFTYTFKGIADNVNLVNLRVLDQNGAGTDSQVIAAIQMAIQLKSKYNIRVINLSLGRPVYESYKLDPLCQAVEQAWKAGIVVVVAAGNDGRDNSVGTSGYGTITAPGNDPYVITVGAMDTQGTPSRADDQIASYSSKGPTLFDHVVKPDLVAPGNRIISLYTSGITLDQLYPGNEIPNSLYQKNGNSTASTSYFILSGTSMATPVVSGAAALLLQQNPSLTPDQVKARLMKTAYKNLIPYTSVTDPLTGQIYNSQSDIFTVGAGYLDIQAVTLASTDLAASNTGSASSPAATQDSSGNIVLVNGSSVVWGKSVIWGTAVVWGNSVIWGTDVSGQSVLWGKLGLLGSQRSVQGYSVVWGKSVCVGQIGDTRRRIHRRCCLW